MTTRREPGRTAETQAACTHCGLPVPAGLIEPGAEEQFCCQGCRMVYRVIHAEGLDRFYALREEDDLPYVPARSTGRTYAEFDEATFQNLYCRSIGAALQAVELYLEGVHCTACLWLVERVGVITPGVVEIRLDISRARARVLWDPARVRLSEIARRLDAFGYPVHPFRGVKAEEMARREDRALIVRLAVAGATGGNVMLIAFALYGGMFYGMAPAYESFFRWVSLLITIPSVIFGGGVFIAGAGSALKARVLHMDLPISLGILTGFAWGAVNTIRGGGEIYFDSVTVLIFLLLVGRLVQRRQQRKAADAAELLYAIAPTSARLLVDGDVREVPVEALTRGARVEVRAGDTVPADGVVRAGVSTLDLSLLTGESRPIAVEPERPVHAGVLNLAARLEVEVTATGEETRVGKLMKLVETCAERRPEIVRLADRISGWFVAAVLVLAAGTAVLWLFLDPARAVDHAVALLVVTCPCALGLATPLAVSAAIGQAARAGILVKGGDVFERLARAGRVWLDKTGTLTEGRLELIRWNGPEEAKRLAAALEAEVSHPLAHGFLEAAGGSRPAPTARRSVEEVRQVPGRGVSGRVDGRPVVVGSPAHAAEVVRALTDAETERVRSLTGDGLTPALVGVDGDVVAVAGFGDPIRGDAAGALARIRARGWRVGMLSGDHPDVAAAVGRRLGLDEADVRGGMLPEAKLEVVELSLARGPVVMVGDGVNDAAALSLATVGIGVHGGAEAALAAADIFLTRPGLSAVAEVFEGSHRTIRVIRRNLIFSLGYNVIGASLAILGVISPLIAAILMPASSITVITSSYRARMFGETKRLS